MFQNDTAQRKKEKAAERRKWAKAAGDHEVLSAKGNADTGKYIQDLNCETSERIRFKPAAPGDSRVSSVKPSCCARRDELPKLAGQVQLTTGKAEVGYDEKKRDMVFSFVRHENDVCGRCMTQTASAAMMKILPPAQWKCAARRHAARKP